MTYEELFAQLCRYNNLEQRILGGQYSGRSEDYSWREGKGAWLQKEFDDAWITSNIYVNRYPRFFECSVHADLWFEIAYVMQGSIVYEIDGKEVPLSRQQTLLILPGTPHGTKKTGEQDIVIYLLLKKDFFLSGFFGETSKRSVLYSYILKNFHEESSTFRYIHFESQNSRRLSLFFQEMMIESLEPGALTQEIVENMAQMIFYELATIYAQTVCVQHKGEKGNVSKILRYMEMHYQTCTLEEVAEQLHFSPNYITKLLKRATGRSFLQIRQEMRLNRAATLLQCSREPVREISHQCGYDNLTFFYRIFKEKYGMTPLEYRTEFFT